MNKSIFIIIVLLILGSIGVNAALRDSLVSCWSYEKNLTDFGFGGNNLAITGAPVWSNSSCFFANKGCINMGTAGNGNYTKSTTMNGFPSGTTSRTVSCWYKPPTILGGGAYEFAYGTNTPNQGFGLSSQTTNYWIWVHTGDQDTGKTVYPNAWTLLSLNSTGDSISFRYNNTEGYWLNFGGLNTVLTTGWFIGAPLTATLTSTSGGVFDDCYVFNKSLTSAEYSDLWNNGLGVTCEDIVTPSSLSVNWNIYTPANNTLANNGNESQIYYFNYTGLSATSANCSFFFNSTNTQTQNSLVNNTKYNFTITKASPYVYTLNNYIQCTANNGLMANSSLKTTRWNLTQGVTSNLSNYVANGIKDDFSVNVSYNSFSDGANNITCYLNRTNTTAAYCNDVSNLLSGNGGVVLSCTLDSLVQQNITYMPYCTNSTGSQLNATSYNILTDVIEPTIYVVNSPQGKTFYSNNITVNFTFVDRNLYRYNVSLDGVTYNNMTNIPAQNFTYNFTYNVSNLRPGLHTLFVEIADGHTAKEIGTYEVKEMTSWFGLKTDGIEFTTKDANTISITSDNTKDFYTEKEKDRYVFYYKPNNVLAKEEEYVLQIILNKPGDILYDANKKYKTWLVSGNQWIDFYNPNIDMDKLRIEQVDDYTYNVYFKYSGDEEYIKFNSIGDLNIINTTYTFYTINTSVTYSSPIIEGSTQTVYLTINRTNVPSISVSPTFRYNYVAQTTNLITDNGILLVYSSTYTVPSITSDLSYQSNWSFSLPDENVSVLYNQSVTNIVIDICNASLTYRMVNLTISDENTGDKLNASLGYNFNFKNSTTINVIGTRYNVSDVGFCTNVNPTSSILYDKFYGTITLTNPEYITRIYTFEEVSAYNINNNVMTTIPLTMIGVNTSTSVTFSWYTTQLQLVEGNMQIYKCELNGSRTLVDTQPVISGKAYANINLLSTSYYYDIIIDGVVYSDSATYSQCHTESVSERTYTVNLNTINVAPQIGLLFTSCVLTKESNNVVNMVWGDNPASTAEIIGCIIAYQYSLNSPYQIFKECGTGGNISRPIPTSDETVYVQGELNQSNQLTYCKKTISFFSGTTSHKVLGNSALFAVMMLVIGLVLLYSSDGFYQLLAAAIAFVFSWFLGILNADAELVTSMIVLLIIVALVGRYARKA